MIFHKKIKKHFFSLGFSFVSLANPFLIGFSSSLIIIGEILPLSAETNNYQFFYERGNEKLKNKNYKGAIADYTKAIEIYPENANAYYNRAIAKENLKDYKGAIADYTNFIKINPEDGEVYFNRGTLKEITKDFKGAIADYTKAIEIYPEDADAYFYRGILKATIGDYKGAIADNNKALLIDSLDNFDLSIEDITDQEMLDESSVLKRVFDKVAGFNGDTYMTPIKYYIHNQTGKIKPRFLPSEIKYAYAISEYEEKFIIDTFSKIDSLIDLDFQQVYTKEEANFHIYKTKLKDDLGITQMKWKQRPAKLIVEIAWSESKKNIPTLKSYPSLSADTAHILLHEIGHALTLSHAGCGKKCSANLDPYDRRINNTDTVMSYNNLLLGGEDRFFTEIDINALRAIWGVEN